MTNSWLPIQGYEGIYEVSESGDVRSLDRLIVGKDGREYRKKGKVLKPVVVSRYLNVCLSKPSCNPKQSRIHRLVATAFIENPCNLPQINHKDGNKMNNHFQNLEWVSAEQNVEHAQKMGLGHISRPVIQYKNGKEIARYDSSSKAGKSVNISSSNILSACKGNYKKSKGYEWKFAN